MVRRRIEGWDLEFSRFLRERNSMPFAYGTNDCLMFPADVVKLLTGFDPAADYRGTYSTEEEAKAILENNGGMANFIGTQLGVIGTRNFLTAGRADVVMMKTTFGLMAGVVDDSGARIAVPLTDQKTLMRFPLDKAWRIWRY